MALRQDSSRGWTIDNSDNANAGLPQTSAQAVSSGPLLEPREGPNPAQWQAVKEQIRILYQTMPLKEVRRKLEQQHGFRATYATPSPPSSTPSRPRPALPWIPHRHGKS